MKVGIHDSFADPENGMTFADMLASRSAADALGEVIIFRSTGPWSMRWIELNYPTKNFHVKGKSSDWGPQAGFVPFDGILSKVGHDAAEAAKGTKKNQDGLDHHFAQKVQLLLSKTELDLQLNRPQENPPRRAIKSMALVAGTQDYLITAERSGDNKPFLFGAERASSTGNYRLWVYPEGTTIPAAGGYPKGVTKPLEVMTSSERGADNRPMTGDYDLMAVCPTWGNYGSKSITEISKPGIDFKGKGVQPGQSFGRGTMLDKVLDMRSTTGAPSVKPKSPGTLEEHGDMGNITARILRAINTLNALMGATGALRRVHHNAESHRHAIFGALTEKEMTKGDGLPLTAFHPRSLSRSPGFGNKYQDVVTLETMGEFRKYAADLHEAGYYVPKNWTWGMSIRDTHKNHVAFR